MTFSLTAMAIAPLIKQSNNYDANIEKYGEHQNSCIICGKLIKAVKYSVHMTTDWNMTTEKECNDSQGYFSVGNDCAKMIHPDFLHKLD